MSEWTPKDKTEEVFKKERGGMVIWNMKRIRGAMLKFARECDRLEAPGEYVTSVGFISLFDEYMVQEFDESWADRRDHELTTPMMKHIFTGLYGNNDEFRELLDEAWEGDDRA